MKNWASLDSRGKVAAAIAALFLLVAVALLLLLAQLGRLIDIGSDVAGPSPSSVHVGWVSSLVNSLKSDRACAIVEFESDMVGMGHVATGVFSHVDVRNAESEEFAIRGSFRILVDLHRRFPRWGHVEDSFPAQAQGIAGGPASRLYPLVYGVRKPGPHYFVAIHAERSKAPREATYIGPLTSGDLTYIPEMVSMLKDTEYASIAEADARNLLARSNPWVVWLGLARLHDLHALQVEDLLAGLRHRAPDDVDEVLYEMLDFARADEPLRKHLTSIMLFESLDPDRQERALHRLLAYYRPDEIPGNRSIDFLVDLRELQAAARVYRERIAQDPERQRILPYLRAIELLR